MNTTEALKHDQLQNELAFLRRLFVDAEEKGELLSFITVAQSSAKLAAKARRELMAASMDHEKIRGDNAERMITLRGLPPSIGWGAIKGWLKERHNIEVNRVDKGPGWTLAILTLTSNNRTMALKSLAGAKIEGGEVKAEAGEPSADELGEQKKKQAEYQASTDTSSFHKQDKSHANKKQRRR